MYEIADSDTIDYTDYNHRRKFRPDLSDSSWLQFWQTGGVGFQCGFFGKIRRSQNPAEATNPDFDEYLTSVNTYDKATASVIISTDALDGDENDIFCCFTSDNWTSDLITQRQNLYTYYDTTTYYYDTPDGAGLTTCQASTWTQPNWLYFRDLSKTGDVYDYYLNPNYQHTLVHGVTWVSYGRFDQQVGQPESYYPPNTAAPFYEMIPKISNKKLNILKNEVALDNVNGKYDGWNGFIYQGLPLLRIEKEGTMKFNLDLTYAEEDLNIAISSVPFDDNISVASYNSRSLSSVIDNWTIDGVKINNAGSVLTAGTSHTISIETGEKCNIFYKITPMDVDSKKRNRVILPKEVLVEYND